MNKERLLAIADVIEGSPPPDLFFNMVDVLYVNKLPHHEKVNTPIKTLREEAHRCGSGGCIMGWAVFLYGGDDKTLLDIGAIEPFAKEYFDLTDDEAGWLFFSWNDNTWPYELRDPMNRDKKKAAERIRYFVEHDGTPSKFDT